MLFVLCVVFCSSVRLCVGNGYIFDKQVGYVYGVLVVCVICGGDLYQYVVQIVCDGVFVDGMGDLVVFDLEVVGVV